MGRDKSQILPLGALPGKRICQVHSENSTRRAAIHVLDSRLSSQRRETSGWTKKQGRFMQADGAVHHVGRCERGVLFFVVSVLEARPPLSFSDQGQRC